MRVTVVVKRTGCAGSCSIQSAVTGKARRGTYGTSCNAWAGAARCWRTSARPRASSAQRARVRGCSKTENRPWATRPLTKAQRRAAPVSSGPETAAEQRKLNASKVVQVYGALSGRLLLLVEVGCFQQRRRVLHGFVDGLNWTARHMTQAKRYQPSVTTGQPSSATASTAVENSAPSCQRPMCCESGGQRLAAPGLQ